MATDDRNDDLGGDGEVTDDLSNEGRSADDIESGDTEEAVRIQGYC